MKNVSERLGQVGEVDEDELALVLRRFESVDVELETLRLVQRVSERGETLVRPARALEAWLEKARPSTPITPTDSGRNRGRLSEEEIRRRVAHRRDLYGRMMEWKGAVGKSEYGPVLDDEALESECREYEDDLRAGKAR